MLTESPRVIFCGELPPSNCTYVAGKRTHRVGSGHCAGLELREQLFFMPGETKRDISAETPQHNYYITLSKSCQLSVREKLRILFFTPKFWKLFVLFPVLRKALKYGRLMVRKKVIPDMVSTPAGRTSSIFRIT